MKLIYDYLLCQIELGFNLAKALQDNITIQTHMSKYTEKLDEPDQVKNVYSFMRS